MESNLYAGYGPPWPPVHVWIDTLTLAAGGVVLLQLGPDGVSPGPLAAGRQSYAGLPWWPTTSPAVGFFTGAGHRVLAFGWDWRGDLLVQAGNIWPSVRTWAAGQPFAIVAHSAGGLLARALYGVMLAAGVQQQLTRMVTLGTPHWGSFAPVLCWFGVRDIYRALRFFNGLHLPQQTREDNLDATVATWPGLYQLQPWAAAGPLFNTNPALAAAIYGAGYYAGANPHLSASWWAQAKVVQGQLLQWLPLPIMVCVYGTGRATVSGLPIQGGQAVLKQPWTFSDGDGTVTADQAQVAGANAAAVAQRHELLSLDPSVLAVALAALGA